jgi:hypothetical protein
MRFIEVTHALPVAPDLVAGCFWDISLWPRIWQGTEAVETLYDDGRHQEFIMVVRRNGAFERVRTIRFRVSDLQIRFFSPEPPPQMDFHHGEWEIEPSSGAGCIVRAKRFYGLKKAPAGGGSAQADPERFHQDFTVRLGQILGSFERYFIDAHP